MLNSRASKHIAPKFLAKSWAVFMPYRRGQGHSEKSGPYVMKLIKQAIAKGGFALGQKVLVEQHLGPHFSDQKAAYQYISKKSFIDASRIAAFGNSFGGIQSLLGAEKLEYCAAVNAAGGASSWDKAPDLRKLMIATAGKLKAPILYFQTANDFSIEPSQKLHATTKKANKIAQIKIYPAFGKTKKDGHSFPYRGVSLWFDDVFNFIEKHCGK